MRAPLTLRSLSRGRRSRLLLPARDGGVDACLQSPSSSDRGAALAGAALAAETLGVRLQRMDERNAVAHFYGDEV